MNSRFEAIALGPWWMSGKGARAELAWSIFLTMPLMRLAQSYTNWCEF